MADSLRRRGTRVMVVESEGYGAQQEDHEIEAEEKLLDQFLDNAGLSEGKVLFKATTDDGDYLEVHISSNHLSVEDARKIRGVKRVSTRIDQSSALSTITCVFLPKHYDVWRNFGPRFKFLSSAAIVGFVACSVFVMVRLSGYGNATDIAVNTLKEGVGLE